MQHFRHLKYVVTALTVMLSAPVWGQTQKPLRIVVPYSAGGTTDMIARAMIPAMAAALARTVIVDNRPGASGIVATRAVKDSGPEGEMLLFHNEGMVVLPMLNKSADYDTARDLAPVAISGYSSSFLVVHGGVPARNVAEFVAWAKAQPNGVESANAGMGSSGHLQTILFGKAAGIKILHVPFKGSIETANALLAGVVKMQLTTPTADLMEQARAGKVKVLGTASPTRLSFAPDVPSISDSVPFSHHGWFGLFTSATTPANVIAQLNRAIAQAMADPAVKKAYIMASIEPTISTPEEFATKVRESTARWSKIIADEKITLQ